MKALLAMFLFAAVLSLQGQTVANTSNVLHPIMKDPSKRNAPSSIDQDPAMSAEFRSTPHRTTPAAVSAHPTQPAIIVARIGTGLAASPLSMIGTVSGIKGRLEVTNLSDKEITPLAQFAVCDAKGFQVGSTYKTGAPLSPNESERIEVIATNLDAADLKLMALTPSPH